MSLFCEVFDCRVLDVKVNCEPWMPFYVSSRDGGSVD